MPKHEHYHRILHITKRNLHLIQTDYWLISDALDIDADNSTYPLLVCRVPSYDQRDDVWQQLGQLGLQGTTMHVCENMSVARMVMGYDYDHADDWEAFE